MKITPFCWIGNKQRYLDILYQYMPPHKVFVDVFGGSGSFILNKPKSEVNIYNDINSDLVNFFRVLQDKNKYKELHHKLSWTPYSSSEFERALNVLKESQDEVELAWAFVISIITSYCGTGVNFALPGRNEFNQQVFLDKIETVRKVMKNIIITNFSYEKIMDRYSFKDVFMFIDPPYLFDRTDFYKHWMDKEQHKELIKKILEVVDKEAMVMLTHYYNEELHKPLLEAGFIMKEYTLKSMLSPINGLERKDCIFLSPNISINPTLF